MVLLYTTDGVDVGVLSIKFGEINLGTGTELVYHTMPHQKTCCPLTRWLILLSQSLGLPDNHAHPARSKNSFSAPFFQHWTLLQPT